MASNDLSGFINFDLSSARGSTSSAHATSSGGWGWLTQAITKGTEQMGASISGYLNKGSAAEAARSRGNILTQALGVDFDWLQTGGSFTELQDMIIGMQGGIERSGIYDKWMGRHSAVKARYAKAGVVVDGGGDEAPMQAVGKLLESMDEEIRYSRMNEGLRRFNEVTLQEIRGKSAKSANEYQQELVTIEADSAVKMAKAGQKAALVSGIAKVAGSALQAYAGK